jgi:hypothetical protein
VGKFYVLTPASPPALRRNYAKCPLRCSAVTLFVPSVCLSQVVCPSGRRCPVSVAASLGSPPATARPSSAPRRPQVAASLGSPRPPPPRSAAAASPGRLHLAAPHLGWFLIHSYV